MKLLSLLSLKKKAITSFAILSSLLMPFYNLSNPVNAQTQPIRTSYIWGKNNLTQIKSTIDYLATNKIKVLNLDIELYQYNSITQAEGYKEIQEVVLYARSKGLKVYGLVGAPTFGEPREENFVFNTLEFIKTYNRSKIGKTAPLDGIHLNIEFYNIKDYDSVLKETYTLNYLKFLKKITRYVGNYQFINPTFGLSSTLPHFADIKNDYIPEVKLDRSISTVFEHNAKIFETIPNTEIVIMAYRSKVFGPNSITDIVSNEFELVKNYKTKINIAVEINDQKDVNVSLYGMTKAQIETILNEIENYYKSNPKYAGLTIHDAKGYEKL